MKVNIKTATSVLSIATLLFAITSCKKDNSLSTESLSNIQTAVTNTQAIAVGVANTSGNSVDSIYVVNTCDPGFHRDSIAFSNLPASVATYLTTNYVGYTAQKAFTVKDVSGTLQGYIAIINYNGSPVGLKFDASGNFVSVLEQREGRDLNESHGFHAGGRFDHRDGQHKDTVALADLPTSVKTYFTTNYATDTLVAAFKHIDRSFVVISKNNGLYATVFTSTGTFVSRAQLSTHTGRATEVAQTALPATALNYLTTTYPNYVFNKAFSMRVNGTAQGYVVLIEANSTRYAVEFDASGSFVKAKTIR